MAILFLDKWDVEFSRNMPANVPREKLPLIDPGIMFNDYDIYGKVFEK